MSGLGMPESAGGMCLPAGRGCPPSAVCPTAPLSDEAVCPTKTTCFRFPASLAPVREKLFCESGSIAIQY